MTPEKTLFVWATIGLISGFGFGVLFEIFRRAWCGKSHKAVPEMQNPQPPPEKVWLPEFNQVCDDFPVDCCEAEKKCECKFVCGKCVAHCDEHKDILTPGFIEDCVTDKPLKTKPAPYGMLNDLQQGMKEAEKDGKRMTDQLTKRIDSKYNTDNLIPPEMKQAMGEKHIVMCQTPANDQ